MPWTPLPVPSSITWTPYNAEDTYIGAFQKDAFQEDAFQTDVWLNEEEPTSIVWTPLTA